MFIDASAIVAILLEEPGAAALEARLEGHDGNLYFSAITRFEASMAIARAKTLKTHSKQAAANIELAQAAVDALLFECGAQKIAIGEAIGTNAIEAAKTYGKAVGHTADLNFGDCFSYACAKTHELKLIYKGNDFALTDLA